MDIFEKAAWLKKNNQVFTLVTVVDSKGSVPGKPGFKMIVMPDGISEGTVGGGALEQAAIAEALKRQSSGENGILQYKLSPETSPDLNNIPMMCEGEITLYYEVVLAKTALFIFGAGHVGSALAEIIKKLDYNITLVDNRKSIAEKPGENDNINIVTDDYQRFLDNLTLPDDPYIVILTHQHKYDYDILKALLRKSATIKYIGVIASSKKAASMRNSLREENIPVPSDTLLFSPVGLDIGGNSAAEIALSIAAQIQAVRYNKPICQ